MKWCEFKIFIERGRTEHLKKFFESRKISSYSEYLPRGGRRAEVRVFIQASRHKELLRDLKRALDIMPGFFPGSGRPEFMVTFRDEKEFEEAWKKHFKPLDVGRFVIVPTWEKAPETGDKRIIRIDPGMAFGTGQHFTTRYCMERMQVVSLDGADMLDAGCGSGILSVAAAMMGAKSILGIDIDREAVKSSERNFRMNCPGASAVFKKMKLERMAGDSFDVILANMTDPVLVRNAAVLQGLLRPGGLLIVSGIRQTHVRKVADAFASLECTHKSGDDKGEWAGLTFRKS